MRRRRFLLGTLAAAITAATAKAAVLLPQGPRKGFKVAAGESRPDGHIRMMGVTANVLDIKISGADTDGRLSVLEQTGHTLNGGPPLHVHPDQDELFFVLEGRYSFQVGDDRFELGAGDTLFLPRGVPHAFLQRTEQARTVVAYQPSGRMEDFFRQSARFTAPPTAEEVAQLFAHHGMQVVGPPLKAE
ncbi:MAG: cupin domain-containing protein [Bacteroidetes bacterium]|nr:cupin domain-containing protein [Bacteroidota bacterium]